MKIFTPPNTMQEFAKLNNLRVRFETKCCLIKSEISRCSNSGWKFVGAHDNAAYLHVLAAGPLSGIIDKLTLNLTDKISVQGNVNE